MSSRRDRIISSWRSNSSIETYRAASRAVLNSRRSRRARTSFERSSVRPAVACVTRLARKCRIYRAYQVGVETVGTGRVEHASVDELADALRSQVEVACQGSRPQIGAHW